VRLADAASWYRCGIETALLEAKDALTLRAGELGRPLYPDEVAAMLDQQLQASRYATQGDEAHA